MYENIIGSQAEKIEYDMFAFGDEQNVTFTPYVQLELIDDVISIKMEQAEKELILQTSLLNDIKELISLATFNFGEKDEYESRLKSLYNLSYISTEVNDLDTNKNILEDKLIQKINELDSLLQVSNHGPLRHLLEEKISNIKRTIVSQPKEEISLENMLTFINHAQSADEINEILCEVFIEEFVNLGAKGREIVAIQLLDYSENYQSNNEFLVELNLLISNYINEARNTSLPDKGKNLSVPNLEEIHKETLEIDEFVRIIG